MNIDNFEIHCFAHPQTVTIIWIEKIYNMNAREWTKLQPYLDTFSLIS